MTDVKIIQDETEKIRLATGKQLLTIEEAAKYVGIVTNDMEEIISGGDCPIKLIGKKYIRIADLARFLYGEITENKEENIVETPVDLGLPQRYPPTKIDDLSEEVYEELVRRGKGQGSIFYNESRKVWQAAISLGYDENGKRRRKIISGKSEKEVEEALQLLLSAYIPSTEERTSVSVMATSVEKNIQKSDEVTLKSVLDNCLMNIKGGPRSRTFANYIGTAKLIEKGIGHLKATEITKDNLQRFLNEFSSKKYTKGKTVDYYSKSAIHKLYLMLKMVVKEAVEKDLIKKPFELKEPKSKKHVTSKRYMALKDDEITAILRAVEDHPLLKTIVTIMVYTGMRPQEVYGLRFQDVNFKNKTIQIEQALSYEWEEVDIKTKTYKSKRVPVIKNLKNDNEGKTAYACRTLKISEKVLDTIKEWQAYLDTMPELLEKRKENGLQDLLFTGVEGQLVLTEYYHQVYERLLAKKGLSSKVYKFYRFRHNFCTRLLKSKIDPKTVMRLMGDNTLDMVLEVYHSLNDDDIIKASGDYATAMDATLENVIRQGWEGDFQYDEEKTNNNVPVLSQQ
jgi:integrase